MNSYLSGDQLYGDNLSQEEIENWYADEQEAYANLGSSDYSSYLYQYHALNWIHGYSHLPDRRFENVLGIGSAYGHELMPIAPKSSQITILDPSSAFHCADVDGVPVAYKKPSASGQIDLPDSSQDLVVCFGVMHHIPNVSFVVREIARVLKDDGYLLMREPIVSMGDWAHPRAGLTKHERGIPLRVMREIFSSAGLVVKRETLVDFPLTAKILGSLRKDVFNSVVFTQIDRMLSWMFTWNLKYHATNILQRFRPTSAFWVVGKK